MKALLSAAVLIAATPATAEVKAVSDAGFAIEHEATIAAPPLEVFAMLRAPAKWWSKDHSWSGDSANLWMDAQAGGCFCEMLRAATPADSGSVEHARIIFAHPGKMLRMTGALGPLQGEAATGTLTFALSPAGAGGTKIVMTYVVGGYARMGMTAIAPAVDSVLGAQLANVTAQFLTPDATPIP